VQGPYAGAVRENLRKKEEYMQKREKKKRNAGGGGAGNVRKSAERAGRERKIEVRNETVERERSENRK